MRGWTRHVDPQSGRCSSFPSLPLPAVSCSLSVFTLRVARYGRSLSRFGRFYTDIRALLDGSGMDSIELDAAFQRHYAELYRAPIVPLHFWYDRVHVCRVTTYKWLLSTHRARSFIEDCVTQTMVPRIKKGGLAAHAQYGTFLWYVCEGDVATVISDSVCACRCACCVLWCIV